MWKENNSRLDSSIFFLLGEQNILLLLTVIRLNISMIPMRLQRERKKLQYWARFMIAIVGSFEKDSQTYFTVEMRVTHTLALTRTLNKRAGRQAGKTIAFLQLPMMVCAC